VYSERELQSRYNILCESYVKTVNVEARLTSMMATTMILPAALRYQEEVANSLIAAKKCQADYGLGLKLDSQVKQFETLAGAVNDLQKSIYDLDKTLAHHAAGDAYSHAKHSRDAVIPAMNAVRAAGDKLETMVADEHWPLPTYREMLFIK
jgi:glutamine synthetase